MVIKSQNHPMHKRADIIIPILKMRNFGGLKIVVNHKETMILT